MRRDMDRLHLAGQGTRAGTQVHRYRRKTQFVEFATHQYTGVTESRWSAGVQGERTAVMEVLRCTSPSNVCGAEALHGTQQAFVFLRATRAGALATCISSNKQTIKRRLTLHAVPCTLPRSTHNPPGPRQS